MSDGPPSSPMFDSPPGSPVLYSDLTSPCEYFIIHLLNVAQTFTRTAPDDQARTRGRRNAPVVAAKISAGPFASPIVPSRPPKLISVAEATPPPSPPLPQPEYHFNGGANRTLEQSLRSSLPFGFKQKRREFIKLFNSNHWNAPGESLDNISVELQQSRALVIAIHYGDRDPLSATYVDAYGILKLLADRVGKTEETDERWPNKDNILESLKWLNEGSIPGSRRQLTSPQLSHIVAGHGYSLNVREGKDVYTGEGILPRDFLTRPPYQDDEGDEEDVSPREVPDPKTVLFYHELNQRLVEGLADGAKLTCCYSGGSTGLHGLAELVPGVKDMSHLRHRRLFRGKVTRSRSSGSDLSLDSLLVGNPLGLPLRVDLANSNSEATLERSQFDDNSMDAEDPSLVAFNTKPEPFPANCEVVSWSACERGQLAREDSGGGRFTNAFIAGMKSNPNTDGKVTYRLLNRHIHTLFEEHNTNEANGDKLRGSGIPPENASAIRGSGNENVEQVEAKEYQYPKLHVSANIVLQAVLPFEDSLVPYNLLNALDDLRARGRPSHSVVAAHKPSGPFETRVPPVPEARHSWVPEPLPLPIPVYPSHPRANTVFEQALDTPLPEFDQKRRDFLKLFDSCWWNCPGEKLDGMGAELEKSKALVIAINYGSSDPLPATYVDAYNIICMLGQQFSYLPKTIRVLADRVDKQNRKDNRWPNKDNIAYSGSTKAYFQIPVAGHGYSLNIEHGEDLYTHEGILPKDFLTYTPQQDENDPTPAKDDPDPETVLFDDGQELNNCLVEGLHDGAKLTIIFDWWVDSAGPRVLGHESYQASTSLYWSRLPLKVDLASSGIEESFDRSQLGSEPVMVENSSTKRINLEFKAFPKHCEVISWSACERGQLAREDVRGGRFTNAFMAGMKPAPNTDQKATYRTLNRSILSQFEEHNQGVSPPNGNKVRGFGGPESSDTARASVNENVEHRERQEYQYPKASTFADKIVII
ncbi:hypothetical protein BDV93DRAFT_570999 [Ceratobasidium sp. AG-I]|nr:hypothetical protein BDV93DRAFT_570999 [Ceratobasidium sp. AG-I]